MVTTRRQEQLMSTPPAAGGRLHEQAAGGTRGDGEASPHTPQGATTVPNGKAATIPLKSALKHARLGPDNGVSGGEEGTPAGAGIKKRVRIHSSSNMVHVFQTSLNTDDRLAAEEAGGDGDGDTPESSPRRRPVRRSSRARGSVNHRGLPKYNQFIAGVFRDMRGGGGGGKAAGAAGGEAVLGMLFTLSWMFASSALIFVNKRLMVDVGFAFPFALTSLGQISSVVLALLAAQLGVAPLRRPPPLSVALSKLMPVSLSFAASLFLGNVAYLGLSVAFINICKAATPLVTLAVGLVLRLERLSAGTLLATLLIALGTAMSTAQEAATGHFHWLSFMAFAASVVFEGLRVVLTEKLMGQARYNVMEALVYLGPFTFLFLMAGAYLTEWQGLSTTGWEVMQQQPMDFAVAAVVSFLVNLFCYLSIKYVSATSFKVAGCLKNVLVVWGGILQGDLITLRELQGYAISLLGFILFSASRLRGGSGQSGDSQPQKKKR